MLWWLLGTAFATLGVEYACGVQGDEIAKIATTAQQSGALAAEHSSGSITTGQDHNDEGEQQQDISLCLLLIVRDEEESLKKNLPVWRDVADCFVVGVDDRTTDRTATTIQEVLGDDKAR